MEKNDCQKLLAELKAMSRELKGIPHFFWLHDHDSGQHVDIGSLSDDDACSVIEAITKRHGGEVIDRVIDKIIQDDERLEFPEILSE